MVTSARNKQTKVWKNKTTTAAPNILYTRWADRLDCFKMYGVAQKQGRCFDWTQL